MHKSTPAQLIDQLIQYKYKSLHIKYTETARYKAEARIQGNLSDRKLRARVDFCYKRINTEGIPFIWTKIWNILSLKGKKCKAPHHNHPEHHRTDQEHMITTLNEYNIHNVYKKLLAFIDIELYAYAAIKDLYIIHETLLSII